MPGQRLGRYEVVERVGAGGMGVVYKARDTVRGHTVALKTLHQLEPGALLRLKNEFRYVANVTHRNLVSLHELMEADGKWFFTMEFIEGESLWALLHRGAQAASTSEEARSRSDATVTVTDGDSVDTVASYLGLRTVGVDAGRFLLNDRPYFVRAVLEQGFWPESHLAAPSDEALRAEVQLIKDMGFNTARIHQKAEDPRFLYWADRLGLLLWGEAPAAFEFTTSAVVDLTREWVELVRRDRSHPSIVTWVPFNESWGVRDILTDAPQRAFSRGLADLTRALDPTRPVISNDGWEHTHSDILTVHDYDGDPETFARRYADHDALKALFGGYGPSHRMMMAEGEADTENLPVMVSEFGGVKYETAPSEPAWGYTTSTTAEELENHLRGIFGALLQSTVLSGFCYTQITDTMQEANGLADENRVPKLPLDVIHSIVAAESHSKP